MMQRRGRVIYSGYSKNFCEHVPKSSIDARSRWIRMDLH